MGKKVIFDDFTCLRNRRPYEYLETAVGLKEAFCELEKIDHDFASINLTKERWDEAAATFGHLKELKEYSDRLFGMRYSSPDQDLPKLIRMHKILVKCSRSEDCLVCKDESHKMKEFVDRCWSKHYLILVIAIILDPRFKMDALQLWYKDIYGSDADGYLEKVIKDFTDVYDEYAAKDSGGDAKSSRSYEMVDAMCSSSSPKSELDLYFEMHRVPGDKFDILAWWSGNASFYPTLARMARDYLAIPIISSSAAIDDTSIEENYTILRSQVADEILPALVCLRGWL